MLPRLPRFARDASGAIAPLFAIGLTVFIGVGALAWDISRGYALRSELEAAVDAAALAGATQLDGSTGSIDRARAAAEGALVQNATRLGDDYSANVVSDDDTIQFLTNLTDPRTGTPDDPDVTTALTETDDKANFIEITLAPRPMGLILGRLFGMNSFNARAHAVAGYGSALCKVPPMMICNPNEASSLDFDASTLTGHVLVLTPAPNGGGGWNPGMFGFLTVNGSGSAAAITDALGRSPPLAECYGQQVTPAGGNIAAADNWFNMRFDIYVNGQPRNVRNDAAKAPNYPPSMNTMIGARTNAGVNGCSPALTMPATDACTSFTAAANGMGFPRDCTQGTTAGLGNGQWNVRKYFATNHSGIDPVTYTPLNPEGTTEGWNYYGPATDGGTAPTRYQVYNWELAILSGALTKPTGSFSGGQDATTGTNRDFARPQCNQAGAQSSPDRRTISAVVLNCDADDAKPNHPATVISYVDLFLIQPAISQTIFAEIIDATSDISEVGKETRFYSVRLYE